jgi:hypothetical protein
MFDFNNLLITRQSKFLIASLIIFISLNLSDVEAQNTPRQLFRDGKEAYANNDYPEAYKKLTQVRESLGEPKLRLQPVLVKATFENRLYYLTKTYLDEYFGLSPSPNLIEYSEMQMYANQIQDILNQSKADYERILKIDDIEQFISAFQVYTNKYQDGTFRDSLANNFGEIDDQAFENVNPNNLLSINHYLDLFSFKLHDDISNPGNYYYWEPSNKEKALKLKDEILYKRALRIGTINAYDNYLYSDESYKNPDNVESIKLKKDDYFFQRAIDEGTIYSYENYLRENENYAQNDNYENIEALLQKKENDKEITSIKNQIKGEKETLNWQSTNASKNYTKAYLSFGVAIGSTYFLYDLYDKSENRGVKLDGIDGLIGTGAGLGLIYGTLYFTKNLKKGNRWSNSADRTKNKIKDLETKIQQLSFIPHINPTTNSFQLAIRIRF